jgi:predicted DNA-binding transcriptional regulator YafY
MGSSGGVSVRQLADELGWHRRTVYRDLEALQLAGFPIYNDQTESGARWMMLDSGRRQMPLPLDLAELMALYFSRGLLTPLKNTVFHSAIESLFEKIKSTLPEETHRYLDNMESTIEIGSSPYHTSGQAADHMETIYAAIAENCCLDILYKGPKRAESTQRTVAPHKIWLIGASFYLAAYCHLRKDARMFAIDRIAEIHISEKPMEIPPAVDMDGLMTDRFGASAGTPERVRIRFRPPATTYVQEKIWHPSQHLTPEADGLLLFEAGMPVSGELVGWVLQWGRGADVLEPESLRTMVRGEIEAIAERYAANNS